VIQQIDPQLWSFIEDHVTSFAKWDVVVFFASHTDGAFAPPQLAAQLARQIDEVEEALRDLADSGVLAAETSQFDRTYRLVPSPELARLVDRFVSVTRAREARLEVLAHLLKSATR
jgi:hypothetical protein